MGTAKRPPSNLFRISLSSSRRGSESLEAKTNRFIATSFGGCVSAPKACKYSIQPRFAEIKTSAGAPNSICLAKILEAANEKRGIFLLCFMKSAAISSIAGFKLAAANTLNVCALQELGLATVRTTAKGLRHRIAIRKILIFKIPDK